MPKSKAVKALFRLITIAALCLLFGGSGCYSLSGSSIDGDFLTSLTPGPVPGPFSIQSVISGNGQAQVYWSSATNAARYRVQYGIVSNIYSVVYSENATSPITLAGLTNGLTYYVRILAISGKGLSTPSTNEAVMLPLQPILGSVSPITTLGMATASTLNVPVLLSGTSTISCGSLLSASSSNSSMLANNQIAFSGNTPNCSVQLSISGGITGSTTVTLNATYGSAVSSQSFAVNITAPAVVAYSLRKVVGGYSGAAINVRRSSDNTTLDIGFTPSGVLDTSALLTFVGAGSGYVTNWYDQSGNSINAAQATLADQPRIVNAGTLDTVNSLPSVYFSGGSAGSYLLLGTSLANTTSTVLMVLYQTNTSDKFPLINTVANWAIRYNLASTLNSLELYAGASASSTAQTIPLALHHLVAIFNGALSTRFINNIQGAVGTAGTNAIGSMFIGARTSGFSTWLGNISEVIILPGVISTPDQNYLYLGQKAFYGTP